MRKITLLILIIAGSLVTNAQKKRGNWLPDSKNSTATHNYTELYFYSDSTTPLVKEEIVIYYNANYDGKSYVYHESKITNDKGRIEVMQKAGMYKFYWKRFGIKKYAWMHSITVRPAAKGKYTDYGHSIGVKWYKRTFLKTRFEAENTINEESKLQLDGLVTYLKKNPEIRIELLGHSYDLENDQQNLYMSKQRTKAVVQYLIRKGVDAKRISSRGNGSTDQKALKGKKATRIEIVEL